MTTYSIYCLMIATIQTRIHAILLWTYSTNPHLLPLKTAYISTKQLRVFKHNVPKVIHHLWLSVSWTYSSMGGRSTFFIFTTVVTMLPMCTLSLSISSWTTVTLVQLLTSIMLLSRSTRSSLIKLIYVFKEYNVMTFHMHVVIVSDLIPFLQRTSKFGKIHAPTRSTKRQVSVDIYSVEGCLSKDFGVDQRVH